MFTERRLWVIVGLAAVIGTGTVGCLEPRAPSEGADAGDAAASDASSESGDGAMTCDLVGDRCEGEGEGEGCCDRSPLTGTRIDLERGCAFPGQRVLGCSRARSNGACAPYTLAPSCVQRAVEGGTEIFGTHSGFVTNLKMIDPAYEACPAEVERQVLAIDTRCDE
jgi:hypothetical protein